MKENNTDTMIVLSKPNNNGFIINENNIDNFLNQDLEPIAIYI